jgi:hypothetical protein
MACNLVHANGRLSETPANVYKTSRHRVSEKGTNHTNESLRSKCFQSSICLNYYMTRQFPYSSSYRLSNKHRVACFRSLGFILNNLLPNMLQFLYIAINNFLRI